MTEHKCSCALCNKNINKFQKRVQLSNENQYRLETKNYHLMCLLKKLNDFKLRKTVYHQ